METIRIYGESLEQMEYFEEALKEKDINFKIEKIYTEGGGIFNNPQTSLVSSFRSMKHFDIMITKTLNNKEIPLLVLEFSTAVTTDDHEFQRSDLLFWTSKYKIPYMKISPLEKKSPTAGSDFGGGNKITVLDQEIALYGLGGAMIHIEWEVDNENNYVKNHTKYISCPSDIDLIGDILEKLIIESEKSEEDRLLYLEKVREIIKEEKLYPEYQKTTNICSFDEWIRLERVALIKKFNTSRRLNYNMKKKELSIKVNRYGHAMDPERGMIFFWRSVLPEEWKVAAEFQIERSTIEGRLSYKSLFDGTSVWPKDKKLIEETMKNRGFSKKFFLEMHTKATNSQLLEFCEISSRKEVHITDESLKKYLNDGEKFNSYKSLMYLCDEIILIDKEREPLLKIQWKKSIVKDHFESFIEEAAQEMTPLSLTRAKPENIKEDYITWCVKKFLEENNYQILSISYPGAQGDTPILFGEGIKTKRTFVDVIAISETKKDLLLIESKDDLLKSEKDYIKLLKLKKDQLNEIKSLIKKINKDRINYSTISLGLAGKSDNTKLEDSKMDVILAVKIYKNNSKISAILGSFDTKELVLDLDFFIVE